MTRQAKVTCELYSASYFKYINLLAKVLTYSSVRMENYFLIRPLRLCHTTCGLLVRGRPKKTQHPRRMTSLKPHWKYVYTWPIFFNYISNKFYISQDRVDQGMQGGAWDLGGKHAFSSFRKYLKLIHYLGTYIASSTLRHIHLRSISQFVWGDRWAHLHCLCLMIN